MKIGIIGLGINGSYIAYKLARKGHDVTVFEQKKKIGGKPCSGLISERIWSFIPKKENLVLEEINFVKIHYPNIVVANFEPKMLVFDRLALERYLVKLAKEEGVEIKLGQSVTMVDLENFDRIIGCDGAMSATRRNLNVKDPRFRLGVYTYINEISKEVETWPTRNGFCWKIPKGDKTEYGCLDSIGKANLEFERFCTKQRIIPKNIKSHLIPEGLRLSNKVFLCGDAAGLTKPWSGGGIVWGLTAADFLINNFPNIRKYNRQMRRFFGLKIPFYRILTRVVRIFNKISVVNSRTIDSDFLFKKLRK